METVDLTLFGCSAFVSYWVRRRMYLGPVDPLQLVASSEAVWVVTIYHLALDGIASPNQVAVFTTCLVIWWAAWWFCGLRWGAGYRRAITGFWRRMADIPNGTAARLTMLYVAGLSTLLLITLFNGGGGDNRLAVLKLVRPMESITTLLVPVVLFRLLIARRGRSRVLLAVILVGMVLTGGKSAILNLLVPVTGAALIGRMRLRFRTVATLVVVALCGFAVSATLNYGVTDPLELFSLLYTRISLDGDVYLLAFPNDLLSQTTTTSLTSYLLGPLIKVFFLPIHVDTSIGAQIGSLLRGEDTVNGPNPHWPIVLLAYHQSALAAALLSALCFALVLWVKLRLPLSLDRRRTPLWLLIPINAYVLLYPQAFFADPSFPLIYLVQAGVLALMLSFLLRPVYPVPARSASGFANPRPLPRLESR